jgi:uncharacterized protein YutE (UPF0331/DUF86 family)
MTDEDLIAKKLAFIETCVRELRTANLDAVDDDVREERFVEHTLQIAVQAALDVASHIVSDERLGEPATNKELFDLLARNEWLDHALVAPLRDMVGFRNVIVHGYGSVDLAIVKNVVRSQLEDLLRFVATIRARLS